MSTNKDTPSAPPWRVGAKLGRTLYWNGRLVGARRSKKGLVELVNWLLANTITHAMATPGPSEADHECG